MASNGPLKIDTGLGDGLSRSQRPPPIAAAFCVIFDARKGYTLAWRESIEGLDVEGIVEYKSLPSGLHSVEEDLVYFVHDKYAGISAFLNRQSKDTRGARMLATGVLVPIQDSRMGQSWLHAEGLKELVGKQIGDPEDVSMLEEYWNRFKISDERHDAAASTDDVFSAGLAKKANGYQKTRAMSDDSPTPSPELSQHHPAKALPVLFKTFGPLVFPLYRAALLRKRILLVGEAPVEINCNFVYAISVLSSIQKILLPLLPVDDVPDMRLRPLFNVGIQDIPLLQRSKDNEEGSGIQDGWVACTTDDILATKPELFDLLVVLPPPHSENATTKIYPKIIPSSPDLSRKTPKTSMRATRRDARRFIGLRAHLRQFRPEATQDPEEAAVDEDTQSVLSSAESTVSRRSVVEPQSWSLIAYTSLLWWASAGEKRSSPDEDEDEEADQDAHLLGDDNDSSSAELAVVSYFHRLTNAIFGTISNAIAKADGDELWERAGVDAEDEDAASGEGEAAAVIDGETNEDSALLSTSPKNDVVEITQDDLISMGLDIWSSSDRTFVEDLVHMWWGRDAAVKGGRIECCGVQIL